MAVQLKTLNGYEFNAAALGGNPASYFLPATGKAADSSLLGGKAPEEFMAADAARIQKVWLWGSASPNSEFAEQTISCDLSDYQEVEVEFRHYNFNESSVFFKARIGTQGFAVTAETYEMNLYVYTRGFVASSDAVSFEGAYTHIIGSQSQAANERLVPVRIYGIKGAVA